MHKSKKTREKILEAALALLEEGGRDVESITIRGIAERAGVSVGLINHHFGSKEQLIEQCVQRIIGGVISAFTPTVPTEDPVEKLQCVAKQVMDFLMDNP
nr:TetR/AcrR family transcriptional regulator [Clostridia bacterium]